MSREKLLEEALRELAHEFCYQICDSAWTDENGKHTPPCRAARAALSAPVAPAKDLRSVLDAHSWIFHGKEICGCGKRYEIGIGRIAYDQWLDHIESVLAGGK
jgi:hypothetical protein